MDKSQRVVVLTGAGVSAESGIKTFRDHGGLWEGYDVMEVASPEGWQKDPELVLNFYNMRRRNLIESKCNEAHRFIAGLEEFFDVDVVTQNVDDLHERAGSSKVLHLHGELRKVRSTGNPDNIKDWDEDLHIGDVCEEGYQLRPHIVWFGEAVPMIEEAAGIVSRADILIIVGTSLVVYPAAGLVNFAHPDSKKFIIDPNMPDIGHIRGAIPIQAPATHGMRTLFEEHLNLPVHGY